MSPMVQKTKNRKNHILAKFFILEPFLVISILSEGPKAYRKKNPSGKNGFIASGSYINLIVPSKFGVTAWT